MAVDVLQILWLGAINVARQVEIEVVLSVTDLGKRNQAGVLLDFDLIVEGIHDLMDVLLPKTILIAVLQEALACINHENAFACGSILLVQHHNARRNASSIKEVRRKTDDALDVSSSNDFPSDIRFDIAAE